MTEKSNNNLDNFKIKRKAKEKEKENQKEKGRGTEKKRNGGKKLFVIIYYID